MIYLVLKVSLDMTQSKYKKYIYTYILAYKTSNWDRHGDINKVLTFFTFEVNNIYEFGKEDKNIHLT